MPEGVEVKLSAELLRPLVEGKRVINAYYDQKGRYSAHDPPNGYEDFLKTVAESVVRVESVDVKGKFMYWKFDNGWYMMNTFGMSGQWSPKEGKHPCFGFFLGEEPDGRFDTIYFNDPRHFGTIQFTKDVQVLNKKLKELGWDPLSQDLEKHLPALTKKIKNLGRPIGQLLMDQKLFAGVGNYIRAEALYLSKISPWRNGSGLSKEEVATLCQSLIDVMQESYQHQGATIHTYTNVYGEEGKYSSCFKVYGQETDPLGNPIRKEASPEGRTIHWCPAVQK